MLLIALPIIIGHFAVLSIGVFIARSITASPFPTWKNLLVIALAGQAIWYLDIAGTLAVLGSSKWFLALPLLAADILYFALTITVWYFAHIALLRGYLFYGDVNPGYIEASIISLPFVPLHLVFLWVMVFAGI